ncbi:hypothetical protein P9B03_07865 [Metasolibacillus meyeri]|uniref:Uncharacterized protein n=1 Tax=Metasolibacillus meyeri TaxID=1071052 RepID=A0AAW9NR63_9BACL|nr:hypothetical protein [Metasolibacillus meyeri]MEC1178393.1 hypothetical protein [Metasolibacillus meyeri]
MCKNMKLIFSFLVVLLVSLSYSFMASAEEVEVNNFDYLFNEGDSEFVVSSGVELVNSPEITPFYRDPRLQKIDGGSGLNKMTGFQSASFARSAGYAGEHDFKTSMLRGITTSIAHFNIFYQKSTRAVYLINREGFGFFTGYYFP